MLPMRFGLTQNNLDHLDDMLMAVSHPDSPGYGKHWSATDLVDKFKPTTQTIEEVVRWLVGSGIHRDRLGLSINRGWIHFNATAAEAEEILKTEYYVFTHEDSGDEQIGRQTYSIPARMEKHIDLIMPTVHFNHLPSPMVQRKRTGGLGALESQPGPHRVEEEVTVTPTLAKCDKLITMECLRALYNIDYTPVATKKNSFGIAEFTPQTYVGGDLDLFFKNFSSTQVGTRPQLVSIDGGELQTDPSKQGFRYAGESNLDLQYAMGLTNPQTITLLQTGDDVIGGSFNTWIDAVDKSYCALNDPVLDPVYPDPTGYNHPPSCGIISPPKVVSISYGQDEASVTNRYANRQCNEYAKLGMMGTSVFYSSGDYGVAGNDGNCLFTHYPSDSGPTGKVFNPSFPSGCPYVTSVGATQINNGSTVHDPESACQRIIYSGGGFSNIFSVPKYQSAAVHTFMTNHTPPYSSSLYNNDGKSRGFPDVSANGANYVIAIGGKFATVYGTSASSPVFASMISLINDARLAQGKNSVGFINPTLYSDKFTSAFNDITTGGNPGCGTKGFNATIGWDPVTGLGTPKFQELLAPLNWNAVSVSRRSGVYICASTADLNSINDFESCPQYYRFRRNEHLTDISFTAMTHGSLQSLASLLINLVGVFIPEELSLDRLRALCAPRPE